MSAPFSAARRCRSPTEDRVPDNSGEQGAGKDDIAGGQATSESRSPTRLIEHLSPSKERARHSKADKSYPMEEGRGYARRKSVNRDNARTVGGYIWRAAETEVEAKAGNKETSGC
jgi:hypothetical protein